MIKETTKAVAAKKKDAGDQQKYRQVEEFKARGNMINNADC
jgi:hypothetical protein